MEPSELSSRSSSLAEAAGKSFFRKPAVLLSRQNSNRANLKLERAQSVSSISSLENSTDEEVDKGKRSRGEPSNIQINDDCVDKNETIAPTQVDVLCGSAKYASDNTLSPRFHHAPVESLPRPENPLKATLRRKLSSKDEEGFNHDVKSGEEMNRNAAEVAAAMERIAKCEYSGTPRNSNCGSDAQRSDFDFEVDVVEGLRDDVSETHDAGALADDSAAPAPASTFTRLYRVDSEFDFVNNTPGTEFAHPKDDVTAIAVETSGRVVSACFSLEGVYQRNSLTTDSAEDAAGVDPDDDDDVRFTGVPPSMVKQRHRSENATHGGRGDGDPAQQQQQQQQHRQQQRSSDSFAWFLSQVNSVLCGVDLADV